jgi:exonuclease VII large subunit
MAYLQANEPYHRVDDGILNGAVWGLGAGAATGGLALGGAYLSMKGIPRRVERMRSRLEEGQQSIHNQLQQVNQSYSDRINELNNRMSSLQDPLIGSNDSKWVRLRKNIEAQMNQNTRKHIERQMRNTERQHQRAVQRFNDKYDALEKKYGKYTEPGYAEQAMKNSLYAKHLSGWKGKAGLIGGAALLGATAGALLDHYYDS